jgi:PAS domain-containing protein
MSEPATSGRLQRSLPDDAADDRPPWHPAYDALPDGVLLTESTGIILGANRAFCDLTGRSQDDWLGRNIDLLAPDGVDLASEVALWYLAG